MCVCGAAVHSQGLHSSQVIFVVVCFRLVLQCTRCSSNQIPPQSSRHVQFDTDPKLSVFIIPSAMEQNECVKKKGYIKVNGL